MRVRALALALLAIVAAAGVAGAQTTGEIFGKVTDESIAVLPGVTVTVTSPVLLQPLTAVTSVTGTYQFPRLQVGVYAVKFELAGFNTVVRPDVQITVGFNAQVNAVMPVSSVKETVTVLGAAPVVDTRETGTKQTFTLEALQSVPSARDPWVILQQTAGIAMDRENIGGNMSGQQSNFVARGANQQNTKYLLDGVDVTDMASTGASISYYDFDSFEEITVRTGGVDVTQQTGGVGVNLVTKSGSDKFRASGRFLVTDDQFESQNITDEMRKQGATAGNPIQNIKDYGFEVGGPIKRGRAWIWGSLAKQTVNVGVVGFYRSTPECQAVKAQPLDYSIADVNACLNADLTELSSTNLKAEVQLFKGNKLSFFNNMAKKFRNARGADDLHPFETTTTQDAVPAQYGRAWWTVGPNPTYKVGDQWVLSDRLLLDVQWAHVGGNYIADVQKPEFLDVQPTLIISTGMNGRSATQVINIRPAHSVNANVNYFAPGVMGGDHSLKVGGYWRGNSSYTATHVGGNATVRFPTALSNDCSLLATGCQVAVTRDGESVYDLNNIALYGQDTFVRGRVTLQLGLRYDRNHNVALASHVSASPLLPDWLPAVDFPGVDPGIVFNNVSPRLGFTYDLRGTGQTLVHANWALYYGQVGSGGGTVATGYAFAINPVTPVTVRYPWVDANNDKTAQTSEIIASSKPLAVTGNWSPLNPTAVATANTIDPELKNDNTQEVIVGFDHQLRGGIAVGVNYIWRKYADFQRLAVQGLSPSDWVPVSFTPAAASCPASQNADCPTVTYYQPTKQVSTVTQLTNFSAAEYNRTFNGIEISARKRMANHWMANVSYSYNSTIVNNGYGGTVGNTYNEDPTNLAMRDGYQYRLPDRRPGIRQRLREHQVDAEDERRIRGAAGLQPRGLLQRAPGFPVRAHDPEPVACQRRRDGHGAARSHRREPAAQLLQRGLPRGSAGEVQGSEPRAVIGRVQPHQQQHDPGAPRDAERGERQPDPGGGGPAGGSHRRQSQVVAIRGGGASAPPFVRRLIPPFAADRLG